MPSLSSTTTNYTSSHHQNHHPFRLPTNQQPSQQQQNPHKAQPLSQPQLYNNNNNPPSPFLQQQQLQQQYYFNNSNNNRQHNMSNTNTFASTPTRKNTPHNQSSWSSYHPNINHDDNHQTAAASSVYTHHSVVNDFYHCLRSQVEFYFSDANLSRDTFLLSLLHSRDHPGRIPVATIASFPKVRVRCGG